MDLARIDATDDNSLFEVFWQHTDAIVCCAWKVALKSFFICDVFCKVLCMNPKLEAPYLIQCHSQYVELENSFLCLF